MLYEAGVAVLARTCFGKRNQGEDQEYVRLSYATSTEQIQEGLARIKKQWKDREDFAKMALDKNPISIVHSMAFHNPGNENVVSRGEAPAWYMLETVKRIVDDPYFQAIEITQIKDSALRKQVAELSVAASGKKLIYSAQPVQLINEEKHHRSHETSVPAMSWKGAKL